jgi:hypothetical protein
LVKGAAYIERKIKTIKNRTKEKYSAEVNDRIDLAIAELINKDLAQFL